MKKKGLLLAVLMMALSLVGCQNASNTDVNNTQEDVSTETQNQSETEHYEYEHKADLTHDGEDETIKVTVEYATADEIPTIKLQVSSADKQIYEEEFLLNYALGSESYLVSYEGKSYLMNYKPLVDHEMATVEFEVFSLDADGNKVAFDNGKMEASLLDVESIDIASWVAFAERENQYFENAYLLVSTCEGELEYSDSESEKTYTETFAWLLSDAKGESAEDNLKAFVEETKKLVTE